MEAANPLPPNMQIVEGGMSDEVMDFLDDIGRADTPEKMAELISLPNDQGEAQPPAK